MLCSLHVNACAVYLGHGQQEWLRFFFLILCKMRCCCRWHLTSPHPPSRDFQGRWPASHEHVRRVGLVSYAGDGRAVAVDKRPGVCVCFCACMCVIRIAERIRKIRNGMHVCNRTIESLHRHHLSKTGVFRTWWTFNLYYSGTGVVPDLPLRR